MRHRKTLEYLFLMFCVFLCLHKQGQERKIGSTSLRATVEARAEMEEEEGGEVVAQQIKWAFPILLGPEVDNWVRKANFVLDLPCPSPPFSFLLRSVVHFCYSSIWPADPSGQSLTILLHVLLPLHQTFLLISHRPSKHH